MYGRILGALVAVALFAPSASAEGIPARVVGIVRDQTGAPMAGVTLTLREQNTGAVLAATSGAKGEFDFPAVHSGTYTLRADRAGFASVEVVNVVVNVDARLSHNLTLASDARETLTVVAQNPPIETASSAIGGVIQDVQLSTLPVAGRQALSLALLLPGTSLDATRSFFSSVNVGSSMTFNSTAVIVDGTSNNWAEDGEPRQDLPLDAIREFRVITALPSAEFGLATGGVVEVVTKSGGNAPSASVFEFVRDRALNTRGRFEREKPPFRRHQYGGTVGGPIVRDRLHFFVASEQTQQDDFYTVNTGLPQFYGAVEGTFSARSSRRLLVVRFDFTATDRQSAFLRYAHEDEHTECSGCGGTVAATAGFDQDTPRRSVVLGHTWLARQDRLNELRVQFARGGYYISPHGVGVWTHTKDFSDARVARLRRTYIFPSLTYGSSMDDLGPEERWQVRDTYGAVLEQHFIKAGVDMNVLPYEQERTGNILGTYTFSEDQYFNPADPASIANLRGAATFSATFPPVHTDKTTRYSALFLQDEWRASHTTIEMGLRAERFDGIGNEDLVLADYPVALPYVDPSKRRNHINVAPRLGIAWNVGGQGTTVVHGGYGMYFGHVRIGANLAEYRNYQQFTVSITSPAYPDPYLGRDPHEFVVSGPANVTVLANDFRQPYSQTLSAGLSHQFASAIVVTADAVYSRTLHDRKIQNLNPRDANGARPLPQFARIDQHQSTGQAKYRAIYIKAEQRMTRRFQWLTAYTWTRSEDNNPLVRYLDPVDTHVDWGPSNSERRHAFVGSGSFLLPRDITVGAVWTFRSQLPWSATAGRDLNRDGFNTDLVPGTTRNQGGRSLDLRAVNAWRQANALPPVEASQIDSSRVNTLDVHVAKSVRINNSTLELIVEALNVLNTSNLQSQFGGGRVTNSLSPLFGRILTARPGRQGQLGLQFHW